MSYEHGPSSAFGSNGFESVVPPSTRKLPELMSRHLEYVYENCADQSLLNRRFRDLVRRLRPSFPRAREA